SPPLSSLSFPFSHCSFLLLPVFFFYSHLNYNGRGRVFPLQEKVEEHIRAAIFISKNPRVQTRWKNTLKLPFLSQKLHDYRRVFIYAEKVEEHIKAAIFISKNPRVQRRWKNTLKLRFLSQKLHEYR
ncbi:hypothetical protein D0Y65_046490, partial [Glycine soja]